MKNTILLLLFVSLTVFSRNPDFTFVAYGDPCVQPLHGTHIVPLIVKQNPKFVIATGDIVDSLEMATVKALNVFSKRAIRSVAEA